MLLNFRIPGLKSAQSSEAADDVNEADFIPYAVHWTDTTLLTKNGELLQTIEIDANADLLDYEHQSQNAPLLRTALRESLKRHIPDRSVAVWIHTVRNRIPIERQPPGGELFATELQQRWHELHPFEYRYANRIYVTLVKESQSADLFKTQDWKAGFVTRKNRQYRNDFLEQAYQSLDKIMAQLAGDLSRTFHTRRLGVTASAHDGKMISEPLSFLYLLVNLEPRQVPVPNGDLSLFLAANDLTFGFNAIEARAGKSQKNFAALLTIKSYRDLPVDIIDRCLQLPQEMIITENYVPIPREQAFKDLEDLMDAVTVSDNHGILYAAGIGELLDNDQGKPADFGQHQLSIMLIKHSYNELDPAVGALREAFGRLGLILVREDIKLEEIFWSQLPANFEFIRRKRATALGLTGGFARLNQYPSGQMHGNHWGDAVTLLPTATGTPYYFNFHVGDNGHTLLLDYNSFPDPTASVALHLLLTQGRRLGNRLIIFDYGHSAELWIRELGGSYHTLMHQATFRDAARKGNIALDPFMLEDNRRNRGFLFAWLGLLMQPPAPEHADHLREALRAFVDEMFELPAGSRNVATVLNQLSQRFEGGLSPAVLAEARVLFDGAPDSLDTSAPILGLDMTAAFAAQEKVGVAAASYLMHRLILSLDDKPAVLVLRNAYALLNNEFFAPRIENLLDMLRERNVMVIFTDSNPQEHMETPLGQILLNASATHLYLPDDLRTDYLGVAAGLDDSDMRELARMERRKGDMLVKRGGEVVSIRLGLNRMDGYTTSILAGDAKSIESRGSGTLA